MAISIEERLESIASILKSLAESIVAHDDQIEKLILLAEKPKRAEPGMALSPEARRVLNHMEHNAR